MAWWHPDFVRLTHLPSGHRVTVEVGSPGGGRGGSFWKAREKAKAMIKGKLYAEQAGDGPKTAIVREYELESGPQDDRGLAQMREFDAKYKPER